MASFQVERKSKDMIKPLSKTPTTYQLSVLDQYAPPVLMPLILYYEAPFSHNYNSQKTTTMLLKNSLSETLVQFYPLAGRVEGNLSIDCNNQGVEFYEADVLASLAEVIANPDPEELIKLLPYAPLSINNNIVSAVQVNHFSCGSMAIGVSVSHKLIDGATVGAFINAWSINARGVSHNDHKLVTFDSASFLPPMDLNGIYDPEINICKEKLVGRRLIFDKEKLDELKKQCDNEQLGSPPSRVGVVSAFLWKMFIKIARAKPTPPKYFSILQPINLRTIKSSPIPENHYGNLYWSALATTQLEPEIEYTEAVGKLRAAVKTIDASYLPKIKTGEGLLELQKAYESFSQEEADFCDVSSLIRFPFYEVNFGWGTPIWVSVTTIPFKNAVLLLPTKCGQGIEAWMNVPEHDVAMLEADHEVCSLASPIIQH